MTISPEQMRAARALLDWSRDDLATATALSADTVRRIESGALQPRKSTIAAIRTAFEQRNVEFIDRNGVALRDEALQTIDGRDCYIRLMDDIYHTLKDVGGEVLFFCADDRVSTPDEVMAENRLRAAGIRFRNIIEDGNETILGDPQEYRSIPSIYFHHELQVVYGNKVAHFMHGQTRIVVIKDKSCAAQARKMFELVWNSAKHFMPSPSRSDVFG